MSTRKHDADEDDEPDESDDALEEKAVRDGPANLQRGIESVGGRLFLTSRRLVFEPHGVNVQSRRLALRLRDIDDVYTSWTRLLGLIPLVPNSIAVTTRDGKTHRFVLFGRADWVRAILDAVEDADEP